MFIIQKRSLLHRLATVQSFGEISYQIKITSALVETPTWVEIYFTISYKNCIVLYYAKVKLKAMKVCYISYYLQTG